MTNEIEGVEGVDKVVRLSSETKAQLRNKGEVTKNCPIKRCPGTILLKSFSTKYEIFECRCGHKIQVVG